SFDLIDNENNYNKKNDNENNDNNKGDDNNEDNNSDNNDNVTIDNVTVDNVQDINKDKKIDEIDARAFKSQFDGRNTLPGTPLSYDLFELDEYLPSQFGSSYGILDE
ncbi:9912_t:CDS:2, partial [Dentiscutata erythropus]